ncbi:hypothetical protein PUN4_460020 [Paraburkholderia unamae]|nr:hypothetical protein PUN4_460020 [Paraburkholderia unamae]
MSAVARQHLNFAYSLAIVANVATVKRHVWRETSQRIEGWLESPQLGRNGNYSRNGELCRYTFNAYRHHNFRGTLRRHGIIRLRRAWARAIIAISHLMFPPKQGIVRRRAPLPRCVSPPTLCCRFACIVQQSLWINRHQGACP